MREVIRHMIFIASMAYMLFCGASINNVYAQRHKKKSSVVEAMSVEKARADAMKQARADRNASSKEEHNYLQFIVEGNDTIYVDEIRAARILDRLPKQKGREWRKYYRTVHNFSKTYPYALVASKILAEVDSTILADNLKGVKRDQYIKRMEKELFEVFEAPVRSLTISQGALLMKLIDREVGKSSYKIIKDYINGMAAGFWQGIAKLFGSDLKKPYDPEGEDEPVEELVELWENDEFDKLYFSLFWEWPPKVEIPSKYR